MENIDIAKIFDEVADLLEIQGANPFRIRAYRTAARTMETLGEPAAQLAGAGDGLDELPGIGEDLAGKIRTILESGDLPLRRELITKIPEGLVELMHIPGLGPKRARLLYDKLQIKSVAQLEKAIAAGRLLELRGFKETLVSKIAQGMRDRQARGGRCRLSEADAYALPLVEHLKSTPGVSRIDVAGSYRRRRETVGDLDILVAASHPKAVAERFVRYPEVQRIEAHGGTRCAVVLRCGLSADLRVVPAASYGAALLYFTGSKAHNIAIRALGMKRGLKINEYGVFRGTRRVGGREEADVFKAVGLPWIPPELREDQGEIDAARGVTLPDLVELDDIRGDLQMHTKYTDGHNTIAEMAAACRKRGYEYLAITDHSKAVRVAGGLEASEFRQQFREIDRVQKGMRGITILKGVEVDILEDGRLDLDDRTLADFDLVVASVHSNFNMTKLAMTRRVVKAMRHPAVHVLGHPTGRLIGKREPYAIDMGEVIKAANGSGVMLEINAQPDRLDLSDLLARRARDAGVKLVINTDAHRVGELACIRYGVDQARRGWCRAADIANTLPLARLRALLEKK
jgi:DNA polymerase (family 10)